ncbi:MAG: HU family DNA-binding protein [Proteobacteria bacterium]|nr:HU family DNA-binding protein [Pseudomonadota bacterium]
MPRLLSRDVAAFIGGKIERHGRVILPGLGTLRLVMRKGRAVRHPASGEIYDIPPRPALVFRPARARRKPET